MSEKVQEYINDFVKSAHTVGFLTYMDLSDHFNELTVFDAKKALMDYAEEHDDQLQKLYDVTCKLAGNSNYCKRLMDEDTLLEFLEDAGEWIIEDVELLMIAGSTKGFCNFLAGKKSTELMNSLSAIRSFIEFAPTNRPVRKVIKPAISSDKKMSAKPNDKPQAETVAKPVKPNVNYRGNGKAGTQLKANHFFKKADTQTSSVDQKMTPVVPTVSTQPPVTKIAEAGLGVKRKREEIEAKFDST